MRGSVARATSAGRTISAGCATTRAGCATAYRVPIKLSRRPPCEWAAALPDIWNHPPEFTTMHRPGIASVSGDTVVLDGTTIEEVRDYHARTFRPVVARLNEAQAQHDAKAQIDASRETAERSSHEENVRVVADEIRFEQPRTGDGSPRSGIS
jgi:hypothetical protein